ncbi:MAG: S41 family peptidase [Chloroflexota bacterium]
MKHSRFFIAFLSAVILTLVSSSGSASAEMLHQKTPPARIINDEGGPVSVTGVLTYTNPLFTLGTTMPLIILEDQAGFIDRDERFILPTSSQVLGQITSDYNTSPFSYALSLPIEPQGNLRDVDQDGVEETGVMVFAIAYWTNIFGDPYLEERDLFGGGWSTGYASTRVSSDAATKREVIGGRLIIYAPDAQQSFPSGFGRDGLLFTADDPIVDIPQGYTVVNLDSLPFVFERSRYPVVDLLEPESVAPDDFSDLTYAEAFDAMIAKLEKEYAFTDYKNIDWAQLAAEFRPRFELAERANNRDGYLGVLHDLLTSIPDGHVSGSLPLNEFRRTTSGGIGMAVRELDNGQVVVNYLNEKGPARQAGITLGAELVAINGTPIQEAIEQVKPWSGPFSTIHFERLQKLRYLLRAPIGQEMEVVYRNFGYQSFVGEDKLSFSQPITATLTAIAERESFNYSSFNLGLTGFELPLDYNLLPGDWGQGYAYAKLYSFSDNALLTIQLWERLMQTLNENNIPGLILDLRQNSGGSGFLADQMSAYFFDEPLELGNTGRYDASQDAFYFDSRTVERLYLPAKELRYRGKVAVLVGPNCQSACEFFAYNLTLKERSTIVGHYPTAGMGGSIDLFLMPENQLIRFTAGRAVDARGEIHVEGKGIVPTVDVPLTQETLFDDDDVLIAAAVAHLSNSTPVDIVEGGTLAFAGATNERTVTGKLKSNTRIRYTLPISSATTVSIYAESSATDALDTVLRLYDDNLVLIAENDDAIGSASANAAIEAWTPDDSSTSDTVVIEIASYEDIGAGDYTLQVVQTPVLIETSLDEPLDEPVAVALLPETDVVSVTGASAAVVTTTVVNTAASTVLTPTVPTPIATAPIATAPTAIAPTTPIATVTPTPDITDTITDTFTTTAIAQADSPATTPSASTGAQSDSAIESTPVPTSTPASTPTPESTAQTLATVQTQGSRLRVRSGPTTESVILAHILNQTAHQVLGYSDDGTWVQVFVIDADDTDESVTGWVSRDFVVLE